MWTTSFEDAAGAPNEKRGVHVVVTPQEQAVREVTLRVAYLPYGLRALPADAVTKQGMQQRTKTFTLRAADAAEKKLAGDLLLGRTSGVTSVAVERIAYSDGSEWTAPAANTCRVTPSGYVPVGAAAVR